ncbi:hypothetical protein FQU96_39245 [Reyranella sp. CPCC 100927]|nr:hypothetical protein FQU96_39245 [Reyranella sp. CPCC 100927]
MAVDEDGDHQQHQRDRRGDGDQSQFLTRWRWRETEQRQEVHGEAGCDVDDDREHLARHGSRRRWRCRPGRRRSGRQRRWWRRRRRTLEPGGRVGAEQENRQQCHDQQAGQHHDRDAAGRRRDQHHQDGPPRIKIARPVASLQNTDATDQAHDLIDHRQSQLRRQRQPAAAHERTVHDLVSKMRDERARHETDGGKPRHRDDQPSDGGYGYRTRRCHGSVTCTLIES